MARLTEQLKDFLARAEVMARGAERRRVDAARALEQDRPWEARAEAFEILEQIPGSPIGLALWADAAEAMWLDHEALEALLELAERAPFRADVWFRIAEARSRLGQDFEADLLRGVEAREPVGAADAARLWLVDVDLHRGDLMRAERWFDQLSLVGATSPDASLRRAELLVAQGHHALAQRVAKEVGEPSPLDGRATLLRARLLAVDEPIAAVPWLGRALVLEAPRADEVGRELLRTHGVEFARALKPWVRDLGMAEESRWLAGFALAEGQTERALGHLQRASTQGIELARQYLSVAVEQRNAEHLGRAIAACELQGEASEPGVRALYEASRASEVEAIQNALDEAGPLAAEWVHELRTRAYAQWFGAQPRWLKIATELKLLAAFFKEERLVHELDATLGDISRPIRVAVVGEFNAGKSSFVNALLGDSVLPVGVVPTTVTQNHLRFSPDRFVRIERRADSGEPDRVVGYERLQATLKELDVGSVERVSVYSPLELLRRVEVLDTPGFNAPDVAHSGAARVALANAHIAIWLLDATLPIKATEREVLEELQQLGLPFVIVINKCDRLNSEQLEKVLGYIEKSLLSLSLKPLIAPIALSAREAMRERTDGDESAPNLEQLEALIEALFQRSSELGRASLIQRIAKVSSRLVPKAEQALQVQVEKKAANEQRRNRLRAALRYLHREYGALSELITQRAGPLIDRFRSDVRPALGVDSRDAATRFLRLRAGEALTPTLARAAVEPLSLAEAEAARATEGLQGRIRSAVGLVGSRCARSEEASQRPELRELAHIILDTLSAELEAMQGFEWAPLSPHAQRMLALDHAARHAADELGARTI